jgi:restriction system protein
MVLSPPTDLLERMSLFVGRSTEYTQLRGLFENDRIFGSVVITGLVGIGKTSLARMFAQSATDLFPGGTGFLNAALHETRGLSAYLPNRIESRYLLVLDDLDAVPQEAQRSLIEELNEAHRRHSFLRSILISRVQLQYPLSQHIFLSGLDEQEFFYLAENIAREMRLSLRPHDLERLHQVSRGHPLVVRLALEGLRSGRADALRELLGYFQAFEAQGLVGPDGRPLSRSSEQQIILDVCATNDEIFMILKEKPEMIRSLPPRKFEELVAEILAKMGYEITLTPEQKDGGFDIYAARREGLGRFLYLVECKRYVPPNKVGVEIVRSLHGVLQTERATAGAIVTTSFFTSGAKEYQRRIEHQMQLHDYIALQNWIKDFPVTRHH